MIIIFFPGVMENAFTHIVWDTTEAAPTKLKTRLFSRQPMIPEPH